MNKMLIHTSKKEEVHIAVIDAKNHQLLEFHMESNSHKVTRGNVYLGIICRIERSLNAAFINYGGARDGFLSLKELHPEYGDITIGQKVIIQIAKEPRDSKGAYLTTYISFSGYYLVYFPTKEKQHGISRKIVDVQRKVVQKILSQIQTPGGHVICRTVASDRQEEEIFQEFLKLKELWESIRHKAKRLKHPKVLYDEHNLATTIIREYIRSDVDNVQIEDKHLYKAVVAELKRCSPLFLPKIHHYLQPTPIFEYHKVHKQIQSLFSREVRLKSGGSLILEQTEALMSIDVNSKHSTKSENIEETALHTNAEAAKEILKQIICRNLSGIIIIDFIDMLSKSNRTAIEKLFLSLAQKDRLRMQITRISKLGIMEISRQRIRSINILGNQETCKACKGAGKVVPVDLPAVITKAVAAYVKTYQPKTLYLTLPVTKIRQLQNQGMEAILALQKTYRLSLVILHSTVLSENQFNLHPYLLEELITPQVPQKRRGLADRITQHLRPLRRLIASMKRFFFQPPSSSEDNAANYKRSIRLHSAPSLIDYEEVEEDFSENHLPSSPPSELDLTGKRGDSKKHTATSQQPAKPVKPGRSKKRKEEELQAPAAQDISVVETLTPVPSTGENSPPSVDTTPPQLLTEVGWQEHVTSKERASLVEQQLVLKPEMALIQLVESKEVQVLSGLVTFTPQVLVLRLGVDVHYHPTMYYANLCPPKFLSS